MKKIILFICVFIFTSIPVFAGSFPDVPADHANYEAVELLDERGIIHGYDDGTFGPDNLVNRAEAMKIIVNAFGIDHNGPYNPIFPDIFEDEWYFPYVMGGYNTGIIDGYDDGTFKPGNYVNLAEFLKIVVIASDVDLPSNVQGDVFVDVNSSEWYAPHALFARDHNVVMPDDYGYLNADQFMTRAAVAEAIYRMLNVLENNGDPYPLDKNWDLYVSTLLPFKIKYDPLSWKLIEYDDEVVFFRGDKEYLQFSPIRVYP
ncbi:hypothetical protein GF366_04890, partial [Candidatus Peregrinibacteria bacterium]|nr:hypothetical protein [Candidatus Peregrinibacteria bacterium]